MSLVGTIPRAMLALSTLCVLWPGDGQPWPWIVRAQIIATHTDQTEIYSGTAPYLTGPPHEMEKEVPELKGLQPIAGQDNLPILMAKVGAKVDELSQKVPDLSAAERVYCCNSIEPRNYQYIAMSRQTPHGKVLDEYRTNKQNQVIAPGAERGPIAIGFVGAWLVFSPANWKEARFRYLGEQRLGAVDTLVVAFAQIPGLVSNPIAMMIAGKNVPLLLEGIAWIDKGDFRILQLRTDLLPPKEKIAYQKVTSTIVFGPAHISELGLNLWLPTTVDVDIQTFGTLYQERHRYTKYRLFHATATIVP
jgi:hypothetical protein